MILLALQLALAPVAASAMPGPPPLQSLKSGSVLDAVERLKPGEFLWMPQAAPHGPILLIVNVRTQRAVLYRNGIPIAVTTVSTGRDGHRTPLGAFTILQKHERHFSNLYDSAPMPFMQRLTWDGVALHGGHLPGYPASHGCIRLPDAFARLLFAETQLGMTVIVTDRASAPALAPTVELFGGSGGRDFLWQPERSPAGPMSIIISGADRRMVVLRDGTLIGSATVTLAGRIERASLFSLAEGCPGVRAWVWIPLPGQDASDDPQLSPRQFQVPEAFRHLMTEALEPGATVVVTPDSLASVGSANAGLIENEPSPAPRR
jgi:hypothetical protein